MASSQFKVLQEGQLWGWLPPGLLQGARCVQVQSHRSSFCALSPSLCFIPIQLHAWLSFQILEVTHSLGKVEEFSTVEYVGAVATNALRNKPRHLGV